MPVLDDGSLVDGEGRIIFVSLKRFQEKVCEGSVCFLCADESACITREHVIPDWILKRFELYDKAMRLPNGTLLRYRNYVVPCCEPCNGLLSRELETPISQAFAKGFEGVNQFLENGGGTKLFFWFALIFIKIHYKDKSLLFNRDRRSNTGSISDEYGYDWGDMHHAYCLARAPYSGASVQPEALGSLAVFSMTPPKYETEAFDVGDLTFAHTFAIRIDDVAVISVFGDGGAVLCTLDQLILQRLEGKLSFPQFRELLAHFACCRLHLKNPPDFATVLNPLSPDHVEVICSKRDTMPEFYQADEGVLGKILEHVLYESTKNSVDIPNFRTRLAKGGLSFLFAEDGSFIKQPEAGDA